MFLTPRGTYSRPGKGCKLSASGKFRALVCPQNSVIHDNGWTEIYALNFGVAWWNPQILMAYPQSIALPPQFSILDSSFSIILPQISLFNSSSSILSQMNWIFDSESPQNSAISNKMSASKATTTLTCRRVVPSKMSTPAQPMTPFFVDCWIISYSRIMDICKTN